MRADRLLSILLLLQARGRMTAAELARELEVSERTIYRDMEALSAAGVPVHAERGPGGGCALLDSYRTTLTGLTRDEARALLLLSIPEPLTSLGLGDELRQALRKVFAALPAQGSSAPRIYLDWAAWGTGRPPSAHLQPVYAALSASRKLKIFYRMWNWVELDRVVAPYGLVAKAGEWYLVFCADGKVDACRITELEETQVLDEMFVPAVDFNLEAWWKAHCAEVEATQVQYHALVKVSPDLLPYLIRVVGEPVLRQLGQPPCADGWVELTLYFESLYSARERLLSFGGAVRVISPEILRLTVQDYARQIVKLYGEG